MVKGYDLYFANPSYKVGDYEDVINNAIDYARCNLLTRHGINIISNYKVEDGYAMRLAIDIPESMMDSFNAGNRLRGVAYYALKNKQELKEARLGNRLFYVRFVTDYDKEED